MLAPPRAHLKHAQNRAVGAHNMQAQLRHFDRQGRLLPRLSEWFQAQQKFAQGALPLMVSASCGELSLTTYQSDPR